MKKYISAIIFGLAIVLSSIFLGKAYKSKNHVEGKIQVTGLGKADFSSDLIVWEGRFGALDNDLKEAFRKLKKNRSIVDEYIIKKGINKNVIVYSAVKTTKRNKAVYSPKGDYIGDNFIGYELTQSIQIESKDVNKVEKISREVTELLNKGVEVYSEPPRYYYTKLANLKVEMISKATEDARIRAENIAKFSGGSLGKLESAKMGVFQITGQNSKEDYSWGGTFNTSSKEKTASITIKLVYKVK